MFAAGVEPVTEQTVLPDEVVFALDVLVVGEHQDRLPGQVVRPGEGDDLLALVVDRVGRDDDVDLAVLDERLAVGRDGLDPLDVVLGDAELGRDDLADLDVEAHRVAVGPIRPNSGWSNLVPIVIVPASASVGHRRARLERGRRLGASASAPSAGVAGAGRQGEHAGGRQGRRSECSAFSCVSLSLRAARAACICGSSAARGRRRCSVLEDLRQEVLGALALRVA